MRLALPVLLVASALALSGCHEILRVTLGSNDPPTHNPPPAGRTAAGTAFTGTATGQLTGRIKLVHGFVKSTMKNGRFFGDFKAQSSNPRLGPLSDAQWHGRFNATRNRATGRVKLSGLILATFTDESAGRACLRLRHRGRRKQNRYPAKAGSSKLTVVGGEGGARTLAGTATARVRLKGHRLRLKGRVSQRQRAATGFTPACTKLEKKFGLTPLAD